MVDLWKRKGFILISARIASQPPETLLIIAVKQSYAMVAPAMRNTPVMRTLMRITHGL